jgi:heptosyltransferase-2
VEVLSLSCKRILVIQTAFPGDSILSLPFIQELKRKYNDYEIDVVCAPMSESIFRASSSVNEVYPFYKRGKNSGLKGLVKFSALLKEVGYSELFSLHRSFRTSLMVSLIKPKHSIGYSNSSLSFVYDSTIDYMYNEHEVKRNLNLLGSDYSNDNWKIFPDISATSDEKSKIAEFKNIEGIADGFVVISPGSVWNTKRYPLKYFIEIAEYFSTKGIKVVVTGGEQERILSEEIVKAVETGIINCCGKFSIVETIELIRCAGVVVTNDSAATHFAMAASVPVLTLYCSTVPEFGFYGYSNKSHYLTNVLYCKPCGIHGHKKCPKGKFECGTSLLPGEAMLKIEEILNGK